jgi:uncharacterized protein (TIGR02466 family)
MLKSVNPLFMSPLFSFEYPDAAQFNERLLAEFAAMRAADPGVKRSNERGWHSASDLFQRQEPATKELAQFILRSMRAAEAKFGIRNEGDFSARVEGWININGKGAFNTPHTHPHYVWSGCYYVRQPDVQEGRSGSIEFIDPRTGMDGWNPGKGTLTRAKFRTRPAAGTLLVFPSYLVHWVYPNEDEGERVSVAFNYTRLEGNGQPASTPI